MCYIQYLMILSFQRKATCMNRNHVSWLNRKKVTGNLLGRVVSLFTATPQLLWQRPIYIKKEKYSNGGKSASRKHAPNSMLSARDWQWER
uniref:Uncharacterized protein n=1 Tax=Pyxicephalus adspersus TaxID=30357 RepID=A0AAV3AZL6_PYXAD|nr:TPA: hypothetical protein GDO54_008180 [Pyxicephalus adspersus]